MSTPRGSVRAAFKAVLDAANVSGGTGALTTFGVTIYDGQPFEGADQRSVVISTISGTNESPGIGMCDSPTKRSVKQNYRLQIDCNYDDRLGCSQLADAVEQAIMEAHDDLRANHDIHNLRKVLDVDSQPLGASLRIPVLTREARVILDFQFWTHRTLAT